MGASSRTFCRSAKNGGHRLRRAVCTDAQQHTPVFYTAAAGIVFGLVYIETGSIWAGTFIHLFNNFFAVIDEAVQATVAPEYAAAISLLGNVLVITAGLVSGVYLVFRRAGKRTDGSQPQPIVPGEECGTLKSFFTPAMITYFAVALLAAVMNML